MAKHAPAGPTREQLTDEQFACVCRVFDILHRVAKRMKAKRALAGGTEDYVGEGI